MRLKLLLVAALFPIAPSAFACAVPMQRCGGEGELSCSAVWEAFNECKRAEFRGAREARRGTAPADPGKDASAVVRKTSALAPR